MNVTFTFEKILATHEITSGCGLFNASMCNICRVAHVLPLRVPPLEATPRIFGSTKAASIFSKVN